MIAAFINLKTLFYVVQTPLTCHSLHLILKRIFYIAQKSFYTSCKAGKLSRVKPVAGPAFTVNCDNMDIILLGSGMKLLVIVTISQL